MRAPRLDRAPGSPSARRLLSLALPLLLLGSSGCLGDLIKGLVHVTPADAEPGMADAGPFEGAVPEHLTLDSVKPDHGSFVGGTEVTMYGFGFTAKTKVTIGGRAPETLRILSPVALELTTPAGEVGPAEVEIDNGEEVVRKPGGFTYDPVAFQPASGPSAGGTLVTLLGRSTAFAPGLKLTLAGKPLTDVEVVSATLLRAKTPPGAEGPADLVWSEGTTEHQAPNAFTYYATANPKSGGMGGGPIQGTLTVTVLNMLNRKPVPGALVLVQRERLYQTQGKTDAKGVAVFTHKDLAGPLTVTAAFPGFEATTVVSFDARDITILLLPIPKPQPGPMGPGTQGGLIGGRGNQGPDSNVLFGGPTGTGDPNWSLVPAPKAGQVKRCYVFTTSPSMEWGPQQPTASATIDWDGTSGATAWPFTLPTHTGSQAVYAVAGLYTHATAAFDAYAMGLTRGVVVGPGERLDVDVVVRIPLTRKITVELHDQPTELGKHQLRLAIALGADGYILRPDNEVKGDGLVKSLAFSRQPPFTDQALVDASYAVDVRLQSPVAEVPLSRATERSVLPTAGVISVGGFIGVPKQVKPAPGSPFSGNTLAWAHTGAPAQLAVTSLALTDATPVWRIISRGDVTTVKLPDPASVGLPAWPSVPLVWSQWLAHLPSFSFDSFNYTHLSSSTWDRWSYDDFELQVP